MDVGGKPDWALAAVERPLRGAVSDGTPCGGVFDIGLFIRVYLDLKGLKFCRAENGVKTGGINCNGVEPIEVDIGGKGVALITFVPF